MSQNCPRCHAETEVDFLNIPEDEIYICDNCLFEAYAQFISFSPKYRVCEGNYTLYWFVNGMFSMNDCEDEILEMDTWPPFDVAVERLLKLVVFS